LSFSSPSSDFVLLATTDITSSTASVSFDGYFSSTYKNYQVVYSNLSPVTDTVNLFFRFRRSNADVTAASYMRWYGSMIGNGSVDGLQGESVSGSTYIRLTHGDISNSQTVPQNGYLYLFNPLGTTAYKSISSVCHSRRGSPNTTYYDLVNASGYLLDATTAISGLTFYYSSGNIALGNFKLYGIK